jgi:hypothetical protein
LTVINDWDQPNKRCTQLVTMSLNFFDRNLQIFYTVCPLQVFPP